MSFIKEIRDEDKEDIREGIVKFLEIKEKWGNEVIFTLISELFDYNTDSDSLIKEILEDLENLFSKTFSVFLINSIAIFNEMVEKFIKDIDVENNDEFLATIKILSATFGRKIRKIKPSMLELCWTRISSGLLISKDEEIKFYSRLTKHSGELVYFEMDIPSVFSFINHILNDINRSIQMVEEKIILALQNQRLNDIETVFIDIFQYRDKFLETKNDNKASKINSSNTDLSSKIKSSLFFSPRGDVRFRYSLMLKEQTIKFDSQYHSSIILILHYLNQILNLSLIHI